MKHPKLGQLDAEIARVLKHYARQGWEMTPTRSHVTCRKGGAIVLAQRKAKRNRGVANLEADFKRAERRMAK